MKYIYHCDACNYTFESAVLPDRCPDCGKQQFSGIPAVRDATAKEIDKYRRIRIEIEKEEEHLYHKP